MGEPAKKQTEKDLSETHGAGEGQLGYRILQNAADIKQLSYDIGGHKHIEDREDNFGVMLGMYAAPRDLFPQIKGATFENFPSAQRQMYEVLQVEIDGLLRTLSEHKNFNLTARGIDLRGSYKHMTCFKADDLREAQAKQANANACSVMLRDGVISKEEYAALCEVEGKGDGVIVQNTAPKIPPTA